MGITVTSTLGTALRKAAVGTLAAMTVAAGTLGFASDAEAQWRRGHRGAAIAAGIIGGIAAGAIIAGASRAHAGYSYGYAPAYGYAPSYGYAPAYSYAPVYAYQPVRSFGHPAYYDYGYAQPAYYPRCVIKRQRTRLDPDTVVIRRVRVCH